MDDGHHTEERSRTHIKMIKVYLIFIMGAIIACATLGNLLIIVSVAYFRKLQTTTNIFIVSLATADFLLAVFVMPFSMVRSVDRWIFGETFCTAHFLLDINFCNTSIFNLSCIALDRYLAVCDPLHYPTRMSRRRIVQLLLVSWLLPIVVSSLIVTQGLYHFGADEKVWAGGPSFCFLRMTKPFSILASTISFFLPMGFMVVAYGKIFLAAQKQVRQINVVENQLAAIYQVQSRFGIQSSHTMRKERKERKAARTLSIILGTFMLCWLPFFITNMVYPLLDYHLRSWILDMVLWLGYTNSALNPVLYAFLNMAYRRAFCIILGCRIFGQSQKDISLSSVPARQMHIDTGTVSS